jgi:hypothetical protein
MIITLVFEKNANSFAENWEKSQKIVIITSTPGHPAEKFDFLRDWHFCDKQSPLEEPLHLSGARFLLSQ